MSNLSSQERTSLQEAGRLFEHAFTQYGKKLFRHALRKLDNEEIAEDLVQETFVAVWNNMDILFRSEEIEPYLHGVLRHKILDVYRRDEVRFKYAADLSMKEQEIAAPADERLLNKELNALIQTELGKMPPRMQEIYHLKKTERMTISQICEQLDLSEQTVKNQMYRATQRLRKRLIEYDSNMLSAGLVLFGLSSFFTK